MTKILVGANITLTDTNKYLLSNKKGYRIAWTVRPIPNNQNKRRLLHYYSKTANKKKGGFYYDELQLFRSNERRCKRVFEE